MLLKRLLVPILALTLFSCTKSTPPPTLSFQGLHDLNMDTAQSEISIPFNVVGTSGISDTVTLSVEGLPPGLQASFTKSTGLPIYPYVFKVTRLSAVSLGTYPIKVTAQTASLSGSQVINLRVTAFNGWTFDYTDFNQSQFDFNETDSPGHVLIKIRNSTNSTPVVTGYLKGSLPSSDGSYRYRIAKWEDSLGPGEIYFEYTDSKQTRFLSAPMINRYATLKAQVGKYSLVVPPTEMMELSPNLTLVRMLSVNSSQQ